MTLTQAKKNTLKKIKAKQAKAQEKNLRNDSYVTRLLVKDSIETLKSSIEQCKDIVDSMPVYDTKSRQNRTFNPRSEYRLGKQFELLSGLLTGVQYSAREHKDQMLEVLGLNELTIELALDAMGSRTYYSKNYQEIVDGTPAEVTTLVDELQEVADALGIVLDDSKLTNKHFDRLEQMARVKATRDLEEDSIALDMSMASVPTV
jgi:rubrerythrin